MHSRLALVALCLSVTACSGASGVGPTAPSSKEKVEERVIVEKLPDGRTKTTTIRTTRRPAPPPPARPADAYPADPLVKYNVDRINAYRAQKGLTALLYDARISAFARSGSEQLARDHAPHAHFAAKAQGAPGFGSRSAENQGDPRGVPALHTDPLQNGKKQIDLMMKLMMDEGPGGGHYDNMMNPSYRRVGIGLFYSGVRLYLTNDFSD